MDDEDNLKNAIKLYNSGKKYYNINKDKAKQYFEQSLEKLGCLKGLNNQLIQTTEAECIKYLNIPDNVFELVTKNDLNKIKNIEFINFREINEDGNTLLHHAIDVGDTGILKELLKNGGMIDTVNGNGNTLLEYACLKKDPNIVEFMANHGANMQKHLFFRKGDRRFYLNKSDIDMAILLKIIIVNRLKTSSDDNNAFSSFSFLQKYLNLNELVGIDKFTVKDILIGLHIMFLNKESYKSYSSIIKEELESYEIEHKKGIICIYNKIDLILSNIVPFINYPYNISSIFILKHEIKVLMKNILIQNKKDFKNILMTKLFNDYIQTELFQEDYIGIIVYNILSKIKI
jgi:hypothetical protein